MSQAAPTMQPHLRAQQALPVKALSEISVAVVTASRHCICTAWRTGVFLGIPFPRACMPAGTARQAWAVYILNDTSKRATHARRMGRAGQGCVSLFVLAAVCPSLCASPCRLCFLPSPVRSDLLTALLCSWREHAWGAPCVFDLQAAACKSTHNERTNPLLKAAPPAPRTCLPACLPTHLAHCLCGSHYCCCAHDGDGPWPCKQATQRRRNAWTKAGSEAERMPCWLSLFCSKRLAHITAQHSTA